MWKGELVSIFISKNFGEEMVEKSGVKAIPGKGLEGDRYLKPTELNEEKYDPSKEVTLIEIESLDAFKNGLRDRYWSRRQSSKLGDPRSAVKSFS